MNFGTTLTSERFVLVAATLRDVNFWRLLNLPNFPAKEERQMLMFSATFPKSIQIRAHEHLRDNFSSFKIGTVGSANQDVTQTILEVPNQTVFCA